MKMETSRTALRLLSALALSIAITSCKLPPRYAMREIQSKGLFNYLATDYSSVSPSHYASAAPFQLKRPYDTPRPINPVPYRTTYHSNRHLKADYNQVPYRPKTVTRSKSGSSSSHAKKTSTRQTPKQSVAKGPTQEKPIAATPKPQVPATSPGTTPSKPEETLPFGTPVAGRPGMVVSPYTEASQKQLVDVTGLPAGEKVKDPYSGKLFRVPPTQQAANQSSPAEKKEAANAPEAKTQP